MGFFSELELGEARRLGVLFGVDVSTVEPLAAGSVNSNFRIRDRAGRSYFARIYEEQGMAGAEAELCLLGELSRAGVPTTSPLRCVSGALAAVTQEKPFAMYPWIDGETICAKQVTPRHCRAVGSALAGIHAASRSVTALSAGRFRVEDLGARLERIEMDAPEHGDAVRFIRRRLAHYAGRRNPGLPAGVVHGDLFRDNVLWHGDAIVALVDFESASTGPLVFDVMVTLEAWCYSDAFDPDRVDAFLAGYEEKRSLSPEESEAMIVEGAIAALRFATTRITDFSMRTPPGQTPARDYRRFLARLEEMETGALSAHIDRRKKSQ